MSSPVEDGKTLKLNLHTPDAQAKDATTSHQSADTTSTLSPLSHKTADPFHNFVDPLCQTNQQGLTPFTLACKAGFAGAAVAIADHVYADSRICYNAGQHRRQTARPADRLPAAQRSFHPGERVGKST